MTQFDGLANLLLEFIGELIKAIKAREIKLPRVRSEFLRNVHDLLGGKAAPKAGQYLISFAQT